MGVVAIRTAGLTKDYGSGRGLFDLDLQVAQQEVFGYLGPNGAGKTTTIRLLMGLIRPTGGSAFIFGLDCVRDAVEVKRRVGYLPGDVPQFGSLRGNEIVAYLGGMRGNVDRRLVRAIAQRFDLDLSRRFREYSSGNKQKLAIVLAFMHRPDLLILDEPTSGLDPLVQQTFYEIIREAKAEGRTVFLSSHILSEVERTCDRVAIIRDGRLVRVDRVEALRDVAHHQVELRFAGDVPVGAFAGLPGVSDVTTDDHTLRLRVSGSITPIVKEAANYDLLDFVSREPSLEETFLAEYARTPEAVA